MDILFDHERLALYRESIEFVAWTSPVPDRISKSWSVQDQLDRASISIPLNIAEGNGKWTPRDRCRFFDNARGSALECAAALDIASAKGFLAQTEISDGKAIWVEIVRMLTGLIKANDPDRESGSADRVREDSELYQLASVNQGEQDQEQE